VKRPKVPLTRPETGEDEALEVAAVLKGGYLTQGPKVAHFEGLVRELTGTRNAIATTSGTTALHLALVALDIGPGDEVLVPDFTFPATANVVVQAGAEPILVDVDPVTFGMDPNDLADRITRRTRAVMPVHPFGMTANMRPIMEVAEAHDFLVVEDAACALGAMFDGRPAGTLGALGCFSFHPRKSITTGEGGMIVTDDDEVAERLRTLRNHGAVRTDDGELRFELAGYNYRLSDILAAVGIAQFRKLPNLVTRRRELAANYRTLLADLPTVQPPVDPPWGNHVYQSFVVLVANRAARDRAISLLAADGIEATIGTYALHQQPFFKRRYGYSRGDLPHSSQAFDRSLTLPLFPSMTAAQQEYVVARLAASL
jgi:dTDP-4-amino-4,6-dideoxygalactose transaminase